MGSAVVTKTSMLGSLEMPSGGHSGDFEGREVRYAFDGVEFGQLVEEP
jgi:hypothetical protein